jgi:hypothetical protein
MKETAMVTPPVAVYLSPAPRTGGIWPVAGHLRPVWPVHWEPGFCPLFRRLPEPADRIEWRWYDFVDDLPLSEAEAWPVIGEA